MTGIRPTDRANAGIAFILVGVTAISVNDMLIKSLSGAYPLHEMVFVRSVFGIVASLVFLQLEGGWSLLRTDAPGLHALRAGLIVIANMTFFAALAVLPLGTATALFFVAPLFITLLAIPVLGERVGPHRLGAIVAGFAGVLLMVRPGGVDLAGEAPRWSLGLPVIAAACYAGMQVLTRKLGARSSAAAMALYIQVTFLAVGVGFFVVASDGRFADGVTDPSLQFLLRAWVWPEAGDVWRFACLGAASAIIGYCLSQAYRLASPATIAPYEYVALPLAIFWGWLAFAEVPGPMVLVGIALIAGAGLYVFARERKRAPRPAARPPQRRY